MKIPNASFGPMSRQEDSSSSLVAVLKRMRLGSSALKRDALSHLAK